MRHLLTVPALIFLLAVAACDGGEDDASSPTATAPRMPDTGGLNLSDAPKTEGAAVETSDGRIVTRIPSSSCIQTTATPLVIGEYAVFATHKKTPKPDDPYGD